MSKKVTKTISITYTEFEVGELVKVSTHRCPLEPGIYKVTKYVPPCLPYETCGTIFVEGHKYGVSDEYFMAVTEEEHGASHREISANEAG